MASAKEIIIRAEDALKTAFHGYDDLIGNDKSRRFTGLRNLIVFGRTVTFVLQNLRSVIGKNKFDDWYIPIQEDLRSDLIMSYFVTLRNNIEKQGKLPVSVSAHVHHISTDMIKNYTKPPGAKSFFIADQLGGSGWELDLPDGSTEKYYVTLPTTVAEVTQHFNELPVPDDDKLKKKSIEELSTYFLKRLESILDSAREEFLKDKTVLVNGKRLPPYMRVIK